MHDRACEKGVAIRVMGATDMSLAYDQNGRQMFGRLFTPIDIPASLTKPAK